MQLTFTQICVKPNTLAPAGKQEPSVRDQTLFRNCRRAEAVACSVTHWLLHGPGSNFCHPPAHGEEINGVKQDVINQMKDETNLMKNYTDVCKSAHSKTTPSVENLKHVEGH